MSISDEQYVYSSLKDKAILIVDDEGFTRTIIKRQLCIISGLIIHEASDGKAAIDQLSEKNNNVALVISDIIMREKDGIELLKAIRSGRTECPRDLPVVVMSAMNSMKFREALRELHANAYLVKPLQYDNMMSTIAKAFRHGIKLLSRDHYESVTVQE